ncbi:hypothetical protein [Nitrosococcus wardiae]|uniref:Uncharacterized protein n=1 Tax=Nitrosococcus wardiae TaxID=1814290 RepID=A0A4P7C2D3_9GAMM|nr:hypothetical protein [Nitrosococcus wardiae]QBQ55837.1 hypothetical protein E3U44_15945 [Nitrosococcus wardiae]
MTMDELTLEFIAQHVKALPKPTPLSTLATKLRKLDIRIKKPELESALEELVRRHQVFCHPPHRGGRNATPCYFGSSAVEYLKDKLLHQQFNAKPTWTEASLRGSVPKAYVKFLDEAVGDLLHAKDLFQWRKRNSVYFSIQPPQPTEFITQAQKDSLQRLLAGINSYRQKPLDLTTLLEFLDGKEGISSPPPANLLDQDLTEELLVRWYGQDLPQREGLRSMPIPWTWQRYRQWCQERGVLPNPDRFHQLLEGMAARSHIALIPHDSPRDLSAEETSVLRRNFEGRLNYYWTLLS